MTKRPTYDLLLPMPITSKIKRAILRKLINAPKRKRAFRQSTYYKPSDTLSLRRLLQLSGRTEIIKSFPNLERVLNDIMSHKFEILGAHLEANAKTFSEVNDSNSAASSTIRKLISSDYKPIDWQCDFKSGYRWNTKQWHKDIPVLAAEGTDIKVPWEIARSHHLVWLSYGIAAYSNPAYGSEIENWILDFISSNPPEFGVNWKCPMDVAIRAANWAAAFDLAKSAGHKFSSRFEELLTTSLYAHAKFVFENLECEGVIGNHYLANIAGLAVVTAYLDSSSDVQAWTNFVSDALQTEAARQFHSEGTNFEGSTAYHRLSTELLFYSCVFSQLTKAPVSKAVWERVYRALDAIENWTKPSGTISQIGDNDSGRLFKFDPSFSNGFESDLDHSHAIKLKHAVFEQRDVGPSLECSMIKTLLSSKAIVIPRLSLSERIEISKTSQAPKAKQTQVYEWPRSAESAVKSISYPEMGYYIYRSDDFFLIVRCGPIGQLGVGGHDHNDQLSIELEINGRARVLDPGSYLYTPQPKVRNSYRSVHAHFAPRIDSSEPAGLQKNLFLLSGVNPGSCVKFNDREFLGWHHGYDAPVYRLIEIDAEKIRITDSYDGSGQLVRLTTDANDPLAHTPGLKYSPAYGRLS